MKTYEIQVNTDEQDRVLKALVKAMKMKMKAHKTKTISPEVERIGRSIVQGYREMLDVKAGKLQARDARDLIDEL